MRFTPNDDLYFRDTSYDRHAQRSSIRTVVNSCGPRWFEVAHSGHLSKVPRHPGGFEFIAAFQTLTREQRLARLDALAKLLDVAFILPGTNIRYGIDGLIGLIPVVGDIITTAFSLWLVREARGSARRGTSRRACSAMSRLMAWSGWCRWQATHST